MEHMDKRASYFYKQLNIHQEKRLPTMLTPTEVKFNSTSADILELWLW